MSSEEVDADADLLFDAKIQKKREIDQLSLELLSNSSHYKKYLAKTEPTESTESSARLFKHKDQVLTMLMDLLDDYDGLTTFSMTGNGEIQRKFKVCVDKILDFLEWTSYKNLPEEQFQNDHFPNEADTMFGNCAFDEQPHITKSFWGKKVNKYS